MVGDIIFKFLNKTKQQQKKKPYNVDPTYPWFYFIFLYIIGEYGGTRNKNIGEDTKDMPQP